MSTLSEIIKPKTPCFYDCIIPSNENNCSKLAYLISLETIRSPPEYKINLCWFEQSLVAQQFVLTVPHVRQWNFWDSLPKGGFTYGFRQECHCQRLSTSVKSSTFPAIIYQSDTLQCEWQESEESLQSCQRKSNFPREELQERLWLTVTGYWTTRSWRSREYHWMECGGHGFCSTVDSDAGTTHGWMDVLEILLLLYWSNKQVKETPAWCMGVMTES